MRRRSWDCYPASVANVCVSTNIPFFVNFFTAMAAKVSQWIVKDFYLFPFFYPSDKAGGN